MDSSFLSPREFRETSCGFEVYYPKTNSLVSVHQRKHCVCFLQASMTSVGIITLTHPGVMANWRDGDHHNNDGGDDVNNPVLTRAEFHNFCDENHQFYEKSQQIIGEIEQKITTLLARKSSHIKNDQFIQRRILNYKKISLFDEVCVSWILLIGFLIWISILIFGRFVMKKKCGLHLINWTMKQMDGRKTFKSIESDEVSIQSAFVKE